MRSFCPTHTLTLCPGSSHQILSYYLLYCVKCVYVTDKCVREIDCCHFFVVPMVPSLPSTSASPLHTIFFLTFFQLLSLCNLTSSALLLLFSQFVLDCWQGIAGNGIPGNVTNTLQGTPDPGTSQPHLTSRAPRWYRCIKATNLPPPIFFLLCLPPRFSVSFSVVALPAASNV